MQDISAADRALSASTSPDDAGAALIQRLEAVPFSRWHMKARIVMGSATFFDAFDALSLAFVLPILAGLWHLSSLEIGFLISASYLGQLVGALVFGQLAERWGRVKSAATAVAIMSVMSLFCILAGSFPALFLCRLVQGVGVGGEMPVAAAYVSELSRAQGRGRFFLLYEMIFPVGLMVTGQIGRWVVPLYGWQIMFLIGGIPGLVICLLLLRLPESPRWLIGQGRLAEAERIIAEVEASTPDRLPPQSRAPRPVPAAASRSGWRELLSPIYRRRTLIVWVLWASAFLVANGLNNWMPTLYRSIYGLNLKDALFAASMTNVAQVLVLLACAFSIDHIGRRRWMMAAFILGAALLAVLSVTAQSVAAVMVLATLAYGVIGSNNAVVYLYTPEIYPTRMRAIGTGLATSWLRLASAVGPALVGFLVGSGGISSVFVLFAVIALIGAVAAAQMIETRGRQLEEIAS
ncbi:MAG TPA: MFS transporter [Stellaceae bacterium]|nr:MFS transporter [Stellaceae bacterium]